ncbi:MAPEG family protein [compost metagenome]
MIIADIVGNAEQVTQDVLAVLYITSRLLYIICYLADWAALRSLVWFVGLGLVVSFFFVSM